MSAYTVTARRSGDWWALAVPELRGVHSQVKRLDQADAMAREAIALMLDLEPDDVEVDVQAELPKGTRAVVEKARRAREARLRAAEAEQEAMREAATALKAESLSQRDASQFLGVSFQRVSQLLGTSTKRTASKGKRTRTTSTTKGTRHKAGRAQARESVTH